MSLTKTQISELYVSIFNRASEKSGSENWLNSGYNTDITIMANAMLNTGAAKSYFGTSLDSNAAFVEHIYANTLNKGGATVDAAGKAGWVEFLETGSSRGEMVAKMIDAIAEYKVGGAKYATADQATKDAAQQFENRVEVSDYTADTLETIEIDEIDSTLSFHRALIVTSKSDTVSMAKNEILDEAEDLYEDQNSQSSYTIANGTLTNTGNDNIILKDFGFDIEGRLTFEGETYSFDLEGTVENGFGGIINGERDYVNGFDFPDIVIPENESYYFNDFLPTSSYLDIQGVSGYMDMEVTLITTVGVFTDESYAQF
ncbi:MAG: hypothetical protein WA945_07955 [Arcobacteraceae bacterium]